MSHTGAGPDVIAVAVVVFSQGQLGETARFALGNWRDKPVTDVDLDDAVRAALTGLVQSAA